MPYHKAHTIQNWLQHYCIMQHNHDDIASLAHSCILLFKNQKQSWQKIRTIIIIALANQCFENNVSKMVIIHLLWKQIIRTYHSLQYNICFRVAVLINNPRTVNQEDPLCEGYILPHFSLTRNRSNLANLLRRSTQVC